MDGLVTRLGRYIPAVMVRRAGMAPTAGDTIPLQRRGIDVLIDAFARTLGGWRPDPWPRGVQEEDRDRRWGRPASGRGHGTAEPPLPAPTLTPLQPHIRQR